MARVYGGWPYNLAQIGIESVENTAVPATTIVRALFGGWDDERTIETVPENIGVLFPAERTRITNEGITIPMPQTAFTFQQSPYIFAASIGTPTITGTGPYVYPFAFPLDETINDLQTVTMELGNRQVTDDIVKVPGCWVQEFELSGEADGLWSISATWRGQQDVSLADFSAATLPAVSEAVFGNTTFSIDDSGGTVGFTNYDDILMDARINVKPGVVWVPAAGGGNLYRSAKKRIQPEITFAFTYELEDGDTVTSTVAQERAFYKSRATRLFSLVCPGEGNDQFEIRFAGQYDNVGPYTDKGGNTVVTFEGHSVMSSSDGLGFEIDVTNDLETLP